MKFYYVYVVYSESFDLHYFGHTSDLDDRIIRHNSNRSKFTKGKGPWKLIIVHKCNSKSQAYRLELKLKALKNPFKAIQYLQKLAQSTPT